MTLYRNDVPRPSPVKLSYFSEPLDQPAQSAAEPPGSPPAHPIDQNPPCLPLALICAWNRRCTELGQDPAQALIALMRADIAGTTVTLTGPAHRELLRQVAEAPKGTTAQNHLGRLILANSDDDDDDDIEGAPRRSDVRTSLRGEWSTPICPPNLPRRPMTEHPPGPVRRLGAPS